MIDVKKIKGWIQPFVVYGMNPLFIFILSELWVLVLVNLINFTIEGRKVNGYEYLYQQVFGPLGGTGKFSSLMFALFNGLLFWLVGYILYRKKIFIKI